MNDHRRKKFTLAVATIQTWVDDPDQRTCQWSDSETDIANELSSPTLNGLVLLANRLEQMARWTGTTGALAVLRNEVAGWAELHRSLSYLAASVRIIWGLSQQRPRWESDFLFCRGAALGLSHAITFRQDDFANWCGDRIVNSIELSSPPFALKWQREAIGPFVANLFAAWKGREVTALPCKARRLEGYQRIFNAWEGGPDLAAALDAVIYERFVMPHNRKGTLHTDCMPYDLFPVDLVALYRVRADLGMPTPAISHPFMQSPLAQEPTGDPPAQDDLLTQVLARVRIELPAAFA